MTLLHEVKEEMRSINARNQELASRNVELEWQATSAEELRQSQLLSLSGPGSNVAASLASFGGGGNAVAEEVAQREHVIDVLRTEVRASSIRTCEIQVRHCHPLDLVPELKANSKCVVATTR